MKHLIAISALSLLLFIATPVLITAHGGDEEGTRVEIRNEAEEVEDEAVEEADEAVTAGTASFEIRGEVTAMSGNTFTVAGISVTSDPTMVSEFEQEGTLAVGSMVKVEGIISSGTFLAEEIKVE